MNSNRLVNSLYLTLAHRFLFLIFPSQPQDPQCFHISEENEVSWQVAGTSVKRNQKAAVSRSPCFLHCPFPAPQPAKFAPCPTSPLQLFVDPMLVLCSCTTVVLTALQTLFLAFSVNDDM